jgi:hypothetical protein
MTIAGFGLPSSSAGAERAQKRRKNVWTAPLMME